MKKLLVPYYKLTFLALAVCLCSCKKFVAIEPSSDLINSDAVFKTDETATAAINGIYIHMRQLSNSLTNGGLGLFTGLSGDEIYNTASSATYDPFYKNSIPPENATIQRNFWTDAYAAVYKTNAVIEGLNRSTRIDISLKNQLIGEAKVVRSLYYFYLVNLFGNVPLITSTDYHINEKMPRIPVAQVYEQITNDLLEAEELLSASYPSLGKVRPNKWTATALLARVYLYQKNWQAAETKAAAIINSGAYSLEPDLTVLFLKDNQETIWEVAPRNEAGNTAQGANFVPSAPTARPSFAVTPHLLNAFETGDQRKSSWTKRNIVNGLSYYYPYKYKVKSSPTPTEYNIVFRLAEQYLIRSEARAQQGNLLDSEMDLNIIRNRAGLPNTLATTQMELLSAIEQERRIELFSEWGHRWFDLKRTVKIDAVLSAEKPSWQSFAALYPIPYSQLELNTYLTQNPGY